MLALLFIKHWYVDFVDQSEEEVRWKGAYFDWRGVKHSVKHGIATALIMSFFIYGIGDMILLGFLDFILHYHIDYCKIKFGNRDITTKAFWAQLGLDQLAHAVTYLWLVWILV
jgi:hypothetical protein